MPAGIHTAKRVPPSKRRSVVNALAHDESKRSIARRFRMSHTSVDIIESQEWAQVSARKQILADQAERNALMAGEQITEALAQRKVPIGSLVPVYGVSIDKALNCRGDTPLVRHEHIHVNADDLIAFAVSRSQRTVKAHEITDGQ